MLTLKEPFQRTASWTAVQPNDDLFGRILVRGREEPEKQLCRIRLIRDG